MSEFTTEQCRQVLADFFASHGIVTKPADWKRSWKRKDDDGVWLRELNHPKVGPALVKESKSGLRVVEARAIGLMMTKKNQGNIELNGWKFSFLADANPDHDGGALDEAAESGDASVPVSGFCVFISPDKNGPVDIDELPSEIEALIPEWMAAVEELTYVIVPEAQYLFDEEREEALSDGSVKIVTYKEAVSALMSKGFRYDEDSCKLAGLFSEGTSSQVNLSGAAATPAPSSPSTGANPMEAVVRPMWDMDCPDHEDQYDPNPAFLRGHSPSAILSAFHFALFKSTADDPMRGFLPNDYVVMIVPAEYWRDTGYACDVEINLNPYLPRNSEDVNGCGTWIIPTRTKTAKDFANELLSLGLTWNKSFQSFIDSSLTAELSALVSAGGTPKPRHP